LDKKELINRYKQTPRPMGVYQIINNINGDIFIGTSINLEARITRHKAELKSGSNRNSELQKEWNEFGEINFTFGILDVLKPDDDPEYNYDEDMETLKDLWINKLSSENKTIFKLPF
jgi:group I intron endonuclease